MPDLALAMPTVSADGTTYTFTLRPNLHYSNGQPVRPQDFRYAMERVFQLSVERCVPSVEGILGRGGLQARTRLVYLDHGITIPMTLPGRSRSI